MRLVRFGGGDGTPVNMDGAIEAPPRVIFSPSGSAAVLYDPGSGRLQILNGLPDSPSARDLPPAGDTLDTVAVSDDGSILLAAGGTLRWLDTDLNMAPVPLSGEMAALSFRRGSHDYLAVSRQGDVYLASNDLANPQIRLVRAADTQTAEAVAVRFSPDGSSALLATRAGTLAILDLGSGSVATLSCQCAP
ncbi:MAG TPA: hypothetical protein VGS58_10590, partial [Candidatus Sulfopaludibacter sp.]|nr:hypothetical protein [Candidatus Sulfopaludibacter sp.]